MVRLFNQGITIQELYTVNPNKKIIDKTYTWLGSQEGNRLDESWERMLSKPFKYCMGLILEDLIENRRRFIFPDAFSSYIDYEVVHQEEFIKQRRDYGRFKEIDFIGSGFTGYQMRFYYHGKAYVKSLPIYPSSEFKARFLELVNSGVKFVTKGETRLSDFIPKVHEKFNYFTIEELRKILWQGFKRLCSAIRSGCAMALSSMTPIKYDLFIGHLPTSRKKYLSEYNFNRDRKFRKLFSWKKQQFDDFVYVGLWGNVLDNWVDTNHKARTILVFENVITHIIKEELYAKGAFIHIFKIPRGKQKGWTKWIDKKSFKNVEYVGFVDKGKLNPAKITWKQLIKELWDKKQATLSAED